MALEQRNDFFSSSTLFTSYCAFLNNRTHLVQLILQLFSSKHLAPPASNLNPVIFVHKQTQTNNGMELNVFPTAFYNSYQTDDAKRHLETDNAGMTCLCAPRAMFLSAAHLRTRKDDTARSTSGGTVAGTERESPWTTGGPQAGRRRPIGNYGRQLAKLLAKWTTLPSHKTQHFHCTHASNRIRSKDFLRKAMTTILIITAKVWLKKYHNAKLSENLNLKELVASDMNNLQLSEFLVASNRTNSQMSASPFRRMTPIIHKQKKKNTSQHSALNLGPCC